MRHLATQLALRGRLAALLSAFLLAALLPASAHAAFLVNVSDAAPASPEASAYSDFTLNVAFPQDSTPKNIDIDLPKGQLGVLNAATECSASDLQADRCPDSSRIGGVSVVAHTTVIGDITAPGSVYRIPATGTEVGRVGVVARPPIGDKMILQGTLRLRDDQSYGIRVSVQNVPKVATLSVPVLGRIPLDITVESMRMVMYGRVGQTGTAGFFFNPAECTTATTVISAEAWDGQRATGRASYTPTNCAGVPFTPSLTFSPQPAAAATPTPLTVKVSQPFAPSAAKIGAPIRATRLTLPEGVQLSGAANSDGQLTDCSDAQFAVDRLSPATCPNASKVGSVVLDSPLVGAVPGDVFLAQPASGPNDLVRLFVVAQRSAAPDGLRVKFMIRVEVDPQTGRLVNTLADLPAQPVNSLTLRFRAGDSPTIRQSRTCGTLNGSATITPFSSPAAVATTGSYAVTSACPAPGRFRPTLGMRTTPTQAGATTTGTTTITLPVGDEPFSALRASLPPGMLANVAGIPRCSLAQARGGSCPEASNVGRVQALAGQGTRPGSFGGTVSLTDAPTDDSIAGLFVQVPVKVGPIFVGNIGITAAIKLRPDYGIDVVSDVPTDIRGVQLDQQELRLIFDRPGFLINPPTCSGNAITGELRSPAGTRAATSNAITTTGCDRMAFTPALEFSATGAPGQPSALTTTVRFPAGTAEAPQSPARGIAVRLPEGTTLSASAGASGDLAGCTDAQFRAGDLAAPSCPAGAAVGAVEIDAPAVGRLSGQAFLAAGSGDALARLFLDATSDDLGPGVRVKVVGLVRVDPATGATTATFDGLPPVTFTRFSLTTRGGAAPVLALPRTCGTFTGAATFIPLNGAEVTREAPLVVDRDCPDPQAFAPALALETSSTQAGAETTLRTTLATDSAGPELRSLDLTLPAGLLGRLTAATQCSLEDARADRCAEDSLVGSVTAEAGVRGAPFSVRGRVYLTAGAGDAIAGLAFSLPAAVGPIDLGTIVTLADLRLTPGDLRLRITAPEVPTQIRGVRLDLQRLAIAVDRPRMVLNPSNCAAQGGVAQFGSAQGQSASAALSYTATGCEALRWAPTLGVRFSGTAADLAVLGHPTITTTIAMPAGQGNLRSAQVTLPAGVATDLKAITSRLCESAAAAAAGTCPPSAQVGSGTIETSALPRPVGAAIFLVKVPGQVLPGIALRIRDQIAFDLVGITKVTPQGRVQVNFDGSPDAPIDRLTLTFVGGANGPIQLGEAICGDPARATDAVLTSQSGAAAPQRVPVDCGGGVQAARAAGSASGLVTLRPEGRRRGLTLVAKASQGVRSVRLTLPAALAFDRRGVKAIRVTGDGGTRLKATVSVRASTINVRLKTSTAKRVQVVVPAAATRFRAPYARKLRRSPAQRKVRPRLAIVDGLGTSFAPRPTLRFSSGG